MHAKRYSLRDIARALGRAVSTIADELTRNRVKRRYDPVKAQHKAYVRRRYARYHRKKLVEHLVLREFVEQRLYDDQSPAAIAGRLRRQRRLPYVSKTSIYRYLWSAYGRRLEHYRQTRRRRRRRRGPRHTPWSNRRSIDTRPAVITRRGRVGDAEGDFIVSGKQGRGILLVVVDRRLRVSFLEPIRHPTCAAVTRACRRIKRRYPEWRTLTTDNDILFQHHAVLERSLGLCIYFCHAYAAWEKGTVENTNRCIRRDIPKGSDLSRYARRFIWALEAKLNRRFLHCLRYATPAELLLRYRHQKQRRSAGRKRR